MCMLCISTPPNDSDTPLAVYILLLSFQSATTRNHRCMLCSRTLILSGPLFTNKTPSYGYRDPHNKPKTVWRPSQVYNGNPYTDKTASSWLIEALESLYPMHAAGPLWTTPPGLRYTGWVWYRVPNRPFHTMTSHKIETCRCSMQYGVWRRCALRQSFFFLKKTAIG